MSLFSVYMQRFLRYRSIFKLATFWHESWPVVKVPEVAHILSFYPMGSKLSLFSLYGQWFPRYGPIFKIAIFGHETWPLAKVAHILPFYPKGSKLSLFLLYGQRFPRYWPIFKITIFGHELGHWPKFQKSYIYSLSTPEGRNRAYFALPATVKEIKQFLALITLIRYTN